MEVAVSGVAAGLHEGPRAGAQIVLGDDVRGRAELPGELDRVAAADLQAAALVERGCPAGNRERLVRVAIAK